MKKRNIIITIIVVVLVAALGVALYMIIGRGSGDGSSDNKENNSESNKDEVLTFVDAHGNWYQTIINPSVPKNPYDKNKFVSESGKMRYDDGTYTVLAPRDGMSADTYAWVSSLRDFGPKYVSDDFCDLSYEQLMSKYNKK